MAVELWTNNAASTLASGITGGDLSLTVASGHGARFPSPTGGDYFFATLDDNASVEIVKCTARSTDTLTIVRAQQGTSGTAFSTGTLVEIRVTKQSLSDLQLTVKEVDGSPLVAGVKTLRVSNGTLTDDGSGQVTVEGAPVGADYWVETANSSLSGEVVVGTTGITTAAYGSRQAAAKAGRLFLPNDSFYVERDTGSAWAPWGPIFPMTPPVDGDFGWFNQGGASVSTTNGGIYLSIPASGTANFRGRTKAKTAPYTITAALLPNFHPSNFAVGFGIFFTDGTKVHAFGIGHDSGTTGAYLLTSRKYTNSTTFSANYVNTDYQPCGSVVWLRIADNNTNRICSFSQDGVNFLTFDTQTRTDFLTATHVGFGGDALNSNPAGLTLLSWQET